MKKRIINTVILLFVAALLLCSCQKEASVLVDETNDEEVIAANSTLARMLVSASQNDGTLDDILDGSPCTSVVLPVTVHANSQQVVVEHIDDLLLIQAIFDYYPDDIDTLEITYPITIVYEDYASEEINSQPDLIKHIAACQSYIEDTYVCVDFNYPISCFTYNALNEQTGRVTLRNNEEWFQYLNYLTEDIFIAIDYVMEVVIDGETIQVDTNEELLDAFNEVDCDVDPGEPLDPQVVMLRDVMKDGSWKIESYLDDGNDQTDVFLGYDFSFFESITVYASNGSNIVYGTWNVNVDTNENLNVAFSMEAPIQNANETYEVQSYSNTELIFVTLNNSGAIVDQLKFVIN